MGAITSTHRCGYVSFYQLRFTVCLFTAVFENSGKQKKKRFEQWEYSKTRGNGRLDFQSK